MDKISSFPKLDSIALLNCVRVPVNEHNKAKIIDQRMYVIDLERTVMDNPLPVERYINFVH